MTGGSSRVLRHLRGRRAQLWRARPQFLPSAIDHHGATRRQALTQRYVVLLDALGAPQQTGSTLSTLQAALTAVLTPLDASRAWLMLAVLTAALPAAEDVLAAVRIAEADGLAAALRAALASPDMRSANSYPAVEILRGAVLVDVDHTAKVDFATGIQRVTRETVRRWVDHFDVTLVGWHTDRPALRRLSAPEVYRACDGGPDVAHVEPGPVVVPVDCCYVLPELATELSRTTSMLALGQFSTNRLCAIGYDLCPITVPETTGPGMPGAFARNLAALRYATDVVPISEAAAVEYRGWASMLPQIGLLGPRVTACRLPNEGHLVGGEALRRAADRLLVGDLPMVLVVGSHEPRKNHAAVLHAAELLWRSGLRFSLTFIGGNSWGAAAFLETLGERQAAGRPVEAISAASDGLLWGAYQLARCTVFPSFDEGFGLPVVESLAVGTPVITSNFGSMAEISAGGGALLVDPRSDAAIAAAIRSLLTDDELRNRLSAEASGQQRRTWDEYADEVWQILAPSAGPDRKHRRPAALDRKG